MIVLVLGLLTWSLVHALRRTAPDARATLGTRLGERGSRGVIAAAIAVGLLLMIAGYRMAPVVPLYTPPSWGVHLNNLLMLGAVALFGLGSSKSRARGWLRHPMLTGVIVWAAAHLLVNGDLASLVLFGGLALWAIGEMVLINANAGPWQRPAPGSAAGDLRLVLITLAVFAVITMIHTWLGYWPFPR
jgi:uncharacterized membrane protein